MTGVRVVLMSAPDRETAEALMERLVEERLAACASLIPGVVSLFRWEGRLQRADEVLVVMKSPADRVEALLRRAAALHPYEVPELLALPVESGAAPYLAWVRDVCIGEED